MCASPMLHMCTVVLVSGEILIAVFAAICTLIHYTPFAVHYEKIRNHLRETAINYAKRHSLARKYEHLHKSQIQ